ncbi:uncharacterized protein LOC128559237 [Mercenaria mercenaria]|uniref:uncharacterized protein LOC128559237 n=1 Tax=Mercenaria mercenaria TaxID=6596 RepID=UPI00234E4AE7|nr:uncharacterized protein LOC128559237 [Mercenaria mercenaria]
MMERCATHHGNVIKKYCADHDVVCCETCNVVRHRSCPHVDKLRHVGKGIKTSVEYKTSKESLDEIISRMKQEKDVRSKNLTSIHQQKEKLMKDVDKFQDEVIDRIKDLAKTSKQQIRSKHEEYKKAIETDEAALGNCYIVSYQNIGKLSAYNDSRVTRVCAYSKAGILLRTFDRDDNDKQILCSLRKIALSAMKELIFLTDKVNGLIVLNKEGKKMWNFNDPELKEARGICVLPGDLVFVSGASSNNILQIDNDGKKEGILVGPSKGLNKPLAMAYDEENSRIIVGCGSNEILVYSISRK